MALATPQTAQQTSTQGAAATAMLPNTTELQVYGLSGWLCSVNMARNARISAVKQELARKAQVPVRQQMLTTSDGRQLDDRDVVEAVLGDCTELTLVKLDASELARLELVAAQRTGQIALARARAMVAARNQQRAVAQAAAGQCTMLQPTTDQ